MKTTTSRKVFCVANTAIMLAIIITCLYPVLYVFFASFSDAAQLMNTDGFLLKPAGFSLDAYKSIFSNNVILNGYKNTLFILVVGTSINLLMTIAAAFFDLYTFGKRSRFKRCVNGLRHLENASWIESAALPNHPRYQLRNTPL